MAPNAAPDTQEVVRADSDCVTCQICFEVFTQKNQKMITRICSTTCPAVLCTPCLEGYLQVSMKVPYSGALPKIRCPICLVLVNKQQWSRYLDPDSPTTELLLQQYQGLCEDSCVFTCPGCHNAQYTQLPGFYQSTQTDLANVITLALRPSEIARIPELRRVVRRFCRHSKTTTARDVIRHITDNFPTSKTNCIVHKVFPLIQDEERRATLLLTYHSIHRRVVTRCCGSFACFNCKRALYDKDTPCTCEEEGIELIDDDDIVECRSCRVMLVKVDGCGSVRCLCGFNMSWTEEQHTMKLHRRKLVPVDPFDLSTYDNWSSWLYTFRCAIGEDNCELWQSATLHSVNNSHPAFREALRQLIWKRRFRKLIGDAELEMRHKFVVRSHPIFKESLRALIWHRRRFHRKLLAECRVEFVTRTARSQSEVMKPVLLKFMWYCHFRHRVLGALLRRFYCLSKGWGDLSEEQQEIEEEQLAFLSIGLN
ncbi:hypothetical protein P3T76_015741 [Phytophthora citrophthora]|uniref:RING-type domain-containing protein n=1 Tax=Phytophthora citrophthora TaxID=4793 RepID=A0AAD9FYV6_9STRA|nr:hypothetical protein P3T76_015741 [Phytophthora citrophthora]